jgi:hypothetical protein
MRGYGPGEGEAAGIFGERRPAGPAAVRIRVGASVLAQLPPETADDGPAAGARWGEGMPRRVFSRGREPSVLAQPRTRGPRRPLRGPRYSGGRPEGSDTGVPGARGGIKSTERPFRPERGPPVLRGREE